jgi:hypothetical protein
MKILRNYRIRTARQLILWRDFIRADKRYVRYPLHATLVGIMIHSWWYIPFPKLSVESLVTLYLNPVYRTIETLVVTGGPVLAVLLGLIGLAQPGIKSKAMSLLGIGLGANVLCMYYLWSNLAEELAGIAEIPIFALCYVIYWPLILISAVSGENEFIAIIVWFIYVVALYVVLRKPILKRIRLTNMQALWTRRR